MINAFILGIIQGLSEFLPISSSGHLYLAREILKIEQSPLLFDVILHLATLIVILFFYKDIVIKLIRAMFNFLFRKSYDKDCMKINRNIILSTLATIIMVLIFKIIGIRVLDLYSLSVNFIISAIFLIGSGYFIKSGGNLSSLNKRSALFLGAAQGFGSLSGISRSGITISLALGTKLSKEDSATYSFLLSIFAILGALVLSIFEYDPNLNTKLELLPTIIAFFSALISGIIGIKFLVYILKGAKLWIFSIYLCLLSGFILIFLV